jgi:hypothetical protein
MYVCSSVQLKLDYGCVCLQASTIRATQWQAEAHMAAAANTRVFLQSQRRTRENLIETLDHNTVSVSKKFSSNSYTGGDFAVVAQDTIKKSSQQNSVELQDLGAEYLENLLASSEL